MDDTTTLRDLREAQSPGEWRSAVLHELIAAEASARAQRDRVESGAFDRSVPDERFIADVYARTKLAIIGYQNAVSRLEEMMVERGFTIPKPPPATEAGSWLMPEPAQGHDERFGRRRR